MSTRATRPETGVAGRRTRTLLLIVLILAGILRFGHLACHRQDPFGPPEETFTHSDIHAFSVWAKRIAAGDILCRDTYHPYMDWMEDIAPLEQFERWWGGREIYHQAPLYPYLAAASYATGGGITPLLVGQTLLSLAAILVLYHLGCRLFDPVAGLTAAAAAALFAPAVVLDAVLLRASLIGSLTLITLWLLHRVLDGPTRRGVLLLGLLLGLGLLLKPTWMLLIPVVLFLLLLHRIPWRLWLLPLGAGLLLCLLPVVARNLVVGAPSLALGTRGPETVYQANNRHADPGFFQPPPKEEYVPSMERAQGSVFAALGTAIDTWPEENRYGWWLWHVGRKALCTLLDYEYPNNTNFYYYRRATPGLAWLPTFGWYVGAALLGIPLLLLRSRRRRDLLPLGLVTATVLAGILISFAHGRYRMPLALLLVLPLGATLSTLIAWIRAGRHHLAALLLLGAVGLSALSYNLAPTRVAFQGSRIHRISMTDSLMIQDLQANRFPEYEKAAKNLTARGRVEEARRLLEGHRRAQERIYRRWVHDLTKGGRYILENARRKSLEGINKVLR